MHPTGDPLGGFFGWGERTRLCKKSPETEPNGRGKRKRRFSTPKTPRIDAVHMECEAVALAAANGRLKVYLHGLAPTSHLTALSNRKSSPPERL